MVKNMTVGKPATILIKFALPMILSGVFQQLYSMVDSIVVGKFDGVNALAAVGASFPVTMLFIAVATGAGIGCSVMVGQFFGMKELTRMKTAIATAIISVLGIAILSTAVGIFCCNGLIALLGTPTDILGASADYLRIYTYGVVFLFLYNITTSIFNGLGDSKTPLIFLVFSSVLNIVLDIIFVRNLHWSVQGVAWATFIAQGLASLLAFGTLLYRLQHIKIEEPMRYFDARILLQMSKIALPSILQFSTVAVGQLLVQALVNQFGAVVIAGYAAAIKVDAFFKIVASMMGTAMSSFAAQNFGANKPERIREGFRASLAVLCAYSLVAVGIVYLFGSALIGLFDNGTNGNEVILVGVRYMRTVAPFYIVFALLMVSNGVLRGTGRMMAFTLSTGIDLCLRVGLSYLLAGLMDYYAIWWAISIGWTVGSIVAFAFYRHHTRSGCSVQPQ